MSYEKKIGKGAGKAFSTSIGMHDLTITKKMKDMTLDELAQLLSDRCDVKDGSIELHSLAFICKERS